MKLPKKDAEELSRRLENGQPHPWAPGRKKGHKGHDGREGRDKLFDAACAAHGLPIPVHEYEFAPPRQWRADYCFEGWLLVEREGGAFIAGHGRHTRGAGFRADLEKYNEAARLGFVVLRFLPEQFDSGEAFAFIKRTLEESA